MDSWAKQMAVSGRVRAIILLWIPEKINVEGKVRFDQKFEGHYGLKFFLSGDLLYRNLQFGCRKFSAAVIVYNDIKKVKLFIFLKASFYVFHPYLGQGRSLKPVCNG